MIKRSVKASNKDDDAEAGDVERADNEAAPESAATRDHAEDETIAVDNTYEEIELENEEEVHKEDTAPHTLAARTREWLGPIWSNRCIGLAIATVVAALWGVLAGLWMPRGPLTTGQALGSIFISLIPFFACGLVTKSLWTLLVAPVTFLIFLEVMKLRVDGPTVDKPMFTTYGTSAFMTGRGVHFLLTVVPMIVGIVFGVAAAHYLSKIEPRRKKWLRYTGYTLMGLSAIGLLTMIIVLAIRPQTEPIEGADSIAELTWVPVNGHDLALMIRGRSIYNPVLLFLAGGPGGSELGAMRAHLKNLETNFTVVTWDQRGCGKSYVALDPLDTISPDGYIDDTLEVTDYLRDRFGQDQIYLLGQSWGSLLGVLAVQESPDRYKAFIGTGQMVSVLETDVIMYNDTLAWAQSTGNEGLINKLTANGPPPYESSVYKYETIASFEHDVYPYDHSMNAEGMGGFSENLNAKEYSLIERLHLFAAFLDTYATVYPQIQDYDFREDDGNSFAVPVFFVQGAHEARARSQVFEEWYPTIAAPIKNMTVLETSGHRPLFEQPHEFVEYMVKTVLSSTK